MLKMLNKKIDINTYMDVKQPFIGPSSESQLGLSVPSIIFEYGSILAKMKSIPSQGPYLLGCLKEVKTSYTSLYNQPENPKTTINNTELIQLKAFIKSLDISHIGFAQVDESFIYSNRKIIYKNAIVLTMEMKADQISTAPSKEAGKEIFRTYYELGVAVNKIKTYLNSLGFNAEAGPAIGGEVNYIRLAQKAGIGYIGKHGVLITPEFGPSLRIAAIYTDINNLPYSKENEHMWIKDFCETCHQCVKKCPSQAIYAETIVSGNNERHIDYKKCAVPFSKNHGCTICVKECTFFKGDYNKIKEQFFKVRS